ncbi:MAG: penicillin-binding transpeptidase domain-containing protein [Actinomycetota bacterium]|nr:penicillin-binding transpeptidase domain-containing protein [Actinomycetota bacterium]
MNRQIKILCVVLIALLLMVVVNLSWVQVFGAKEISGNAFNKRRLIEEYGIQRGEIITADEQVIARCVQVGAGSSPYRYQREYPAGSLFADITGYDSWKYGRTGLEERFNDELLGRGSKLTFTNLLNRLVSASKKGNSIVLTVDSRLQRVASDALEGRRGAAVVIDPKTGAVLAMVTSPTYDPNVVIPLPGRDTETPWGNLTQDQTHPLVNRATQGLYPPGSSFKVITAAAALETGIARPETEFTCNGKLPVHGYTIYDYGRTTHGRLNFRRALTVSCNITFAQVGLRLGGEVLVHFAELFGFNQKILFELPVADSRIDRPSDMDKVALASSAFGQGDDLATPLEMALVACAVANNGVIMKPFLMNEIQDYNGKIIEQVTPKKWLEPISTETAETLEEMMVDVVEKGTGTAAQIEGVDVAGKTGTAEVEGAKPHSWFICFAPAIEPKVAISVVVENAGEGGRVAAPIARKILLKALSL